MKLSDGITVSAACNLSVDRPTAEACVKLVEIFMRQNRGISLHVEKGQDGTDILRLEGLNGLEQEAKKSERAGSEHWQDGVAAH